MTWLVFGVSCLLVLAGAVSIISGAPIVQIERGWTEVIAGAVALSSGGIVFALAGILLRLEALRDALASGAPIPAPTRPLNLPAEAEPTRSADESPTAQPEAALAISPLVEEVGAPSLEEDRTEGLWKRVRRPDESVPAAPLNDRLAATPVPTGPSLEPNAPAAIPVQERPQRDQPATSLPSIAVEPPPSPALPESRADEVSLSWLDRSLLRGRKPLTSLPGDIVDRPIETPPDLARPVPSSRIEPALDMPRRSAIESRVEAAKAETPAAVEPTIPTISAAEPEAPAPIDEVTVVGRYQAGVASYVMYSDGTIEVETESGESHRFASMEELKAYIAQQDSPAA